MKENKRETESETEREGFRGRRKKRGRWSTRQESEQVPVVKIKRNRVKR